MRVYSMQPTMLKQAAEHHKKAAVHHESAAICVKANSLRKVG